MSTCIVIKISNSCHNQPYHELSRIQVALERLLQVKCSFSHVVTEPNDGSEHQEHDSTWQCINDGSVTSEKEGSEIQQVQNTSAGTTLQLTILFETKVSKKQTSIAEKFVLAHLTSASNYEIKHHALKSQSDFDMVVQSAASIQSETLALLAFDETTLKLSIQGIKGSVNAARNKIVHDSLAQQRSVVEPSISTDECSVDQNMTRLSLLPEHLRCDTEVSGSNGSNNVPTCGSDKHVAQVSVGKQASNEMSVSLHEEEEKEEERNLESSFESTDEEECYNQQHINKAIELNYSEELVKKVLSKLGAGCAFNDVLSELIAQSSSEKQTGSDVETSVPRSSGNFTSISQTDSFTSSELSAQSGLFSPTVSDIVPNMPDPTDTSNLRHIIIDGSNVAMSHGKTSFSCKGIKIVVDWFKARGHKYITAFVPKWRKESSRPDAPITDQKLLEELDHENIVAYTPARRVKGRRVVCYDDRYILKLAAETEGIVVSNDVYRDLVQEREDFAKVVEQRLLMYTFVNDRFMPPEDPLGRTGPSLDNFLRKVPIEPRPRPPDCPYGKKCTYGNKCRFYHPERGFAQQKSVTEMIKEKARVSLQERANKTMESTSEKGRRPKQRLARTKSLVPGSILTSMGSRHGSVASADSLSSVSVGQVSEKPKLAHSKSLNFSTLSSTSKTADYLDNARKRLESSVDSADLDISVSQFATQTCAVDQLGWLTSSSGPSCPSTSNPISTLSTSPELLHGAISPPLPKDGHVSSIIELPVFTECAPAAQPCHNSQSPRASPSHLTIPTVQEPEGPFIKGHLAVAQKLSDEGSDSNFFSEHTSASSTPRTLSPVVLPVEKKRGKPKSPKIGNRNSVATNQYFSMKENPAITDTTVATETDIDDIPNLSIFAKDMSLYTGSEMNSQDQQMYGKDTNPLSSGSSPLPKIASIVNGAVSHVPRAAVSSPGGGSIVSSKAHGIPFQQAQQHPMPSPLTQVSHSPWFSQAPRRGSEITQPSYTVYNSHQPLRAQSSVPDMAQYNLNHAYPPPTPRQVTPWSLNRQNSSSDPQINIAAAPQVSGVDVNRLYQPNSVACRLADSDLAYMSASQPYQPHRQQYSFAPGDSYRQPRVVGQGQNQNRRVSFDSEHVYSRLQQPQFDRFNQAPPLQSVLSPYQDVMPPAGYYQPQQHHQQPFSSPYMPHYNNDVECVAMSQLSSGSTHNQQMYQYPPPTHPVSYPHSPATYFPTNQSGMPPFSSSVAHPPPNHHSVIGQVSPDAPILRSDPRHSLYSHLSTAFSESIVRRAMNMNPQLTKADDVITVIMEQIQPLLSDKC